MLFPTELQEHAADQYLVSKDFEGTGLTNFVIPQKWVFFQGKCAQLFLRTIAQAFTLSTPTLRAAVAIDTPCATRLRKERTCSTVTLAALLCSPCCFPWLRAVPTAALPFRHISFMLSCCVPTNKCAGFTHSLTSHVCRTCRPSSIGPLKSRKETLCAVRWRPPKKKAPYPLLLTPACHRQQPLAFFWIFVKKRVFAFSTYEVSHDGGCVS